jgi:predicted DNA-binding transcriptional regulator YafY
MPKNKNFQKRITILDECFSSKTGFFTLEKLIERVSIKLDNDVSRRTIQNDIKYIINIIEDDLSKNDDLEVFPVFEKKIFDGKKRVFRYSKPEYALGNHLLNKSDKDQLEDTLAILSRYRHRQEFSWLDELFPRIEKAFHLVNEDVESLISYQTNKDYTGQQFVGKLYNQLLKNNVIEVEYHSFKSENSYIRTIHPYHLKQYNNRWFLFGYEETNKFKGITNLALDRILGFKETNKNIEPNSTDWEDYFDEFIGVSKNLSKSAIKVVMRFSKNRIKYVLTKPIHGVTQKSIKNDSEGRTISIKVIPNNELYQLLLSYGSDVEVLFPEDVKIKLKEHAEKMLEYYKI